MTATAEPLVSVVIPTRNRAALLARAVHSVLAQTYANLELIVVDDASTDGTASLIGTVVDPRLRYLRHDRPRGAAVARNSGIRAATGALFAFQDDDDLWLVQKLERQVQHLLASPPDVGLSLCSYLRLWPTYGDYVGGAAFFSQLRFDRGDQGDFSLLATPGWLLRREVLERVGGFDESLPSHEDWELACRLWYACRFAHLDEPLFVQDRTRPGTGLWANTQARFESRRLIIDKHGSRWSRRDLSRHFYLLGRDQILVGQIQDARRWLRRALRSDPGNLRAAGVLLVSLGGLRSLHAVRRARKALAAGPR